MLRIRNFAILAFLVALLHANGTSQNCTALFGPSGTPPNGTNYLLCTIPGTVVLDATTTAATATGYTWSANAGSVTTPTATVNAVGTYTVTISHGGNPNACILDFTVSLTTPIDPGLGSDTTICPGDTITLGSNLNYASYAWNTSATTATIQTDTGGTFQVTVTDGNGCTATDNIVVSEHVLPTPTIGADTTICPGDSIQIGPANAFTSYSWTGGATTQQIFVQTPGSYSVTVTDANTCSGSDTLVLSNHPAPVTNLGVSDTVCADSTVILSPGTFYANYQWSDFSTNDSLTLTAPTGGTVWVRTTDTNGCISTDTVTIGFYPAVVVNSSADTTICPGDTITLDAGAGFVNYVWADNNGVSQVITVTQTGSYIITVTDTNGCEGVDTTEVFGYTSPAVSIGDTTVCPGDTATLTATAGFVQYAWSTGSTVGNTIQTDSTGTYSVTVTDLQGCEGSAFGDVLFHVLPLVDLGPDDTLCVGQTKVLNAGAGFTQYTWDDNSSLQTRTVVGGDTYWVEVVDTNTCINSDTVNILLDLGPPIDLGPDTAICLFDSITLDPGPGLAPYTWSTTATSQTINVSAPDTYSVTVTAPNGCTSSDSIIITNLALPVVDIGNDLDYCQGTTFNQPIDAGVGFVQYQWMDGSFTQINVIDQLDDTVWVEVTDANTCRNRDTLFVIQLNLPPVNLGVDDTVCAGQSRILNAGNAGGLINGYSWAPTPGTGQTITVGVAANLANPVTNTYQVTVTDTNTCQNSDTIDITFVPLPIPNLGNDTAYCIGDPFQLTLDPGTFAQYQWSTGSTTPTIIALAFDSSYSVVVTDTNGCTQSDNITVTENALPQPDLGNDTSYCEGENFNIILNPGGFAQYAWTGGSPDPFILVNGPGLYEVTVTDVNGCQQTEDKLVTRNPKPTVNLGIDSIICEDSTFTRLLDASLQLPFVGFSYLWNDGTTNPVFQVLDFGTYTVTVTDDNTGCQDSSSISYIPFGTARPDLGPDTLICEGEVLTLDPEIQSEGYSYLWNTGATTNTINVDRPGTYWVELNAVNGACQGIRDTVDLTLGLLPIVELGDNIRTCIGKQVIFFEEGSSFPDANYLWQDTIPGARFIVGKSGTYRVKVENRCGTATDEISILFDDCFEIYVPNSFTPNGDGRNDIFEARTDQELLEYSLLIYDRWGNAIFKTNDINAGWDGTYNGPGGDELPTEVYVWKIEFISAQDPRGTRRQKIGTVTVIR